MKFLSLIFCFPRMVTKFGLTLEVAQGFHHFFEDHKDKDEYKFLLNRMNALEVRFLRSRPVHSPLFASRFLPGKGPNLHGVI